MPQHSRRAAGAPIMIIPLSEVSVSEALGVIKTPDTEYPVWTPLQAFDAADALLQMLHKQQSATFSSSSPPAASRS